jgi:hypothetical protein
MGYHWVHVQLAAIDVDEMRDLVEEAWAFCVPKRVAEQYVRARGEDRIPSASAPNPGDPIEPHH